MGVKFGFYTVFLFRVTSEGTIQSVRVGHIGNVLYSLRTVQSTLLSSVGVQNKLLSRNRFERSERSFRPNGNHSSLSEDGR